MNGLAGAISTPPTHQLLLPWQEHTGDLDTWFQPLQGRDQGWSFSAGAGITYTHLACIWTRGEGADAETRSSFLLRITCPQSSVTPPLAGSSGRRPAGMWRSPAPPPVVVDLAWGPHTRHGAGGGNLQRPVSATRATSTLASSSPSPSSHGSEMVKTDRRGLILTKPNQRRREGTAITVATAAATASSVSVSAAATASSVSVSGAAAVSYVSVSAAAAAANTAKTEDRCLGPRHRRLRPCHRRLRPCHRCLRLRHRRLRPRRRIRGCHCRWYCCGYCWYCCGSGCDRCASLDFLNPLCKVNKKR